MKYLIKESNNTSLTLCGGKITATCRRAAKRQRVPLGRRARLLCFAALLFLVPQLISAQRTDAQRTDAQISQETATLLRNAKIQVVNQRTDPHAFSLPMLTGGIAALSDFKGRIVILNFWATWCPPCRAEMPSMENLYQRFRDQGLEILAVDIGEDENTIRRFINNNKYTFPVLLDTNKRISNSYGIEAIPTTYILDREGKIIARVVGSISWDSAQAIAAFDALLNNR